jgi:TolA-binding protein
MDYMTVERKRTGRKVNAWIADDLYAKVDDLKYKTWTEAIVAGLELLVRSTQEVHEESIEKVQMSTGDDSEVLRARLVEMDKHIETLQSSLEQANKDKDYLKETHSNYMAQVQTIIKQDEKRQLQIEAPKKSWYKFW